MANELNVHEFLPYQELLTAIGDGYCMEGSIYQSLCVFVLNIIGGFSKEIDPVITNKLFHIELMSFALLEFHSGD